MIADSRGDILALTPDFGLEGSIRDLSEHCVSLFERLTQKLAKKFGNTNYLLLVQPRL